MKNGLIAFASGGEIYVVDVEGRDPRTLGPGVDPVWSPDGTKIAFLQAARSGMRRLSIIVMNRDGTDPHQLTPPRSNARQLSWSPDGTSISFQGPPNGHVIRAVNADGTKTGRLVDAEGGEAAWSPDGNKIAFKGLKRPGSDIFSVDIGGSNLTNLTDEYGYDSEPAWSPDGSRIAYRHVNDLVVMNADGNGKTLLAPSGGSAPAWAPDGERIAFVGNGIQVVGVEGTDRTRLTRGMRGSQTAPTWSPDGSKIAFVSGDYTTKDVDVWVMDADGSDKRKLTEHLHPQAHLSWQPVVSGPSP
ncbi:MAG: hypothetical protein WD757_00890 [Actinomycetota bacterium]